MELPEKLKIVQLVKESPRTVVSFANRLFAREEFSQRELFEIAEKLMVKVGVEDRVHLWQAAMLMVRRELVEAAEDWYFLAKARMQEVLAPREYGAISDFLAEQRMYESEKLLKLGSFDTREFNTYIQVHFLGRTVGPSKLKELFDLLSIAASDESFLVRAVAVGTVGRLCTRSDIEDADMLPFREQIKSIVGSLSNDNHSYVRESLDTTVYFLELAELL